jgi:REP element-mobilizing transposase RayT
MKYDPLKHHRRSIRLKGYDYTQPGAYFVTVCTHERADLFGEVVDGEMRLNDMGRVVAEEWFKTAALRPTVHLRSDEFVVMPNHVHGIIVIHDPGVGAGVGAERRSAPTTGTSDLPNGPRRNVAAGSVGAIVRGFKSAVTYRINALRNHRGAPLWQRNYYEHIIRNERELHAIRQYIRNNPLKWALDRDNPRNTRRLPPPTGMGEYLSDLEIP